MRRPAARGGSDSVMIIVAGVMHRPIPIDTTTRPGSTDG